MQTFTQVPVTGDNISRLTLPDLEVHLFVFFDFQTFKIKYHRKNYNKTTFTFRCSPVLSLKVCTLSCLCLKEFEELIDLTNKLVNEPKALRLRSRLFWSKLKNVKLELTTIDLDLPTCRPHRFIKKRWSFFPSIINKVMYQLKPSVRGYRLVGF